MAPSRLSFHGAWGTMKNFRNGQQDVSPALAHPDTRPRFTFLRIGPTGMIFAPGPVLDIGHMGMTPTPRDFLKDYVEAYEESTPHG